MNLYIFEDIYDKIKNNKLFALNYIKDLHKTYNIKLKYDKIKYNDDILSLIYSFIPLPTKLIINNNYTNINNEYTYLGIGNMKNILTTDRTIYLNNIIPFTLPIINNFNYSIDLILSNVYYYELTILNKINKNIDKSNNYISIGFTSNDFKNTIVNYNSLGIIREKFRNRKFKPWENGDTVGIGFIYINPNLINFFFTNNGNIINMYGYYINSTTQLSPIIHYYHSNSIKLNFSNDEFLYNIKNLINYNLVLSSNNIFMQNYNSEIFNNNLINMENNILNNPLLLNNSVIFNNSIMMNDNINNINNIINNSITIENNINYILNNLTSADNNINNLSSTDNNINNLSSADNNINNLTSTDNNINILTSTGNILTSTDNNTENNLTSTDYNINNLTSTNNYINNLTTSTGNNLTTSTGNNLTTSTENNLITYIGNIIIY